MSLIFLECGLYIAAGEIGEGQCGFHFGCLLFFFLGVTPFAKAKGVTPKKKKREVAKSLGAAGERRSLSLTRAVSPED